MAINDQLEQAGTTFAEMLEVAAKLPGVRINRTAYLRSALKRYCSDDQIEKATALSPAAAGVPFDVLTQMANTAIKYETAKVTGLSAAAGIPGGLAMLGTVPADAAQYLGHMLRIAQKLAYIYGWPDLFDDRRDGMDEATEGVFILFVGVMLGNTVAQGGIAKLARLMAQHVARELPKRALTKGVIYPIVKKVAVKLSVDMTKQIFASSLAKAIPLLGAVASGGLTLGTFLPMSRRLQKHLASLEVTKPGHRRESGDGPEETTDPFKDGPPDSDEDAADSC